MKCIMQNVKATSFALFQLRVAKGLFGKAIACARPYKPERGIRHLAPSPSIDERHPVSRKGSLRTPQDLQSASHLNEQTSWLSRTARTIEKWIRVIIHLLDDAPSRDTSIVINLNSAILASFHPYHVQEMTTQTSYHLPLDVHIDTDTTPIHTQISYLLYAALRKHQSLSLPTSCSSRYHGRYSCTSL